MTGEIVKVSDNKYVWTVKEDGYSPVFLIKGCKTRLHLERKRVYRFAGWEVNVYLDSKIAPTTGVNISISSLKSGILLCKKSILWSDDNITPDKKLAYKISKRFPIDPINTDSQIHIQCEFFHLSVEPLTQIKSSQPSQAAVPGQKLGKGFQELLDSGKFSDVIIVSKGAKFDVHKCVLVAQSKVFAAMLKDGTKESKENKIEINDIDGDIMKEVLKFIYTGEVTDIDKLAYELVAPADKYEIKGLLDLCESTLSKSISLDNIKSILTLINLYNLPLLKSAAFKILKNDPGFVKSTDLNDFLKKLSPSLLTEMITYVL